MKFMTSMPFVGRSLPGRSFVAVLVLVVAGTGLAIGQDVEFQSLVTARTSTSLLVHDGIGLLGLDSGGLLFWAEDDPASFWHLTAGSELSHNRVTDLAYSGAHVWVATAGGGLTRITDLAGERQYRQYVSSLGDLQLTAVTGAVLEGGERVFYAMKDKGIGRINDGSYGQIYTADQDGLIDDSIHDLAMYQGNLFVATPSGLSLFANNVFVDINDGLISTVARSLLAIDDEALYCGAGQYVYRWSDADQNWASIGDLGGEVVDLVAQGDVLWAVTGLSDEDGTLMQRDGDSWTLVETPSELVRNVAVGQELWISGRMRDEAMDRQTGFAFFGRQAGDDWDYWSASASLIGNAFGLSFDGDNRIWIGSLNGDAISGFDGQDWQHAFQVASAENGWNGMFNHAGAMLTVTADSAGGVWFTQYLAGAVRYRPAAAVAGDEDLYDRITIDNSGLSGRTIYRMRAHPDGALFVLIDPQSPQGEGVDILVDPDDWADTERWLSLTQANSGLNGRVVTDVVVERNDIVWFAVSGAGLVRWDINGDAFGPDDAITWLETADDRWDDPIDSFLGAPLDPKAAVALARAADGSIWFGGGGVGRFSYDEQFRSAELHESYGERYSGGPPGLLSTNIIGLGADLNDDLWVGSTSGLNRIRRRGSEVQIDAYTDVENYFANPSFSTLYSPNIIQPLTGLVYRRLQVANDSSLLALSGTQGVALIRVTELEEASVSADPLAQLFVYPNPFPGDYTGEQLKLGGLSADYESGDPAQVEIFNLEGELVYRSKFVTADEGFWDGKNRFDDPVASGLYVIKVSYRGAAVVKTLAVVR